MRSFGGLRREQLTGGFIGRRGRKKHAGKAPLSQPGQIGEMPAQQSGEGGVRQLPDMPGIWNRRGALGFRRGDDQAAFRFEQALDLGQQLVLFGQVFDQLETDDQIEGSVRQTGPTGIAQLEAQTGTPIMLAGVCHGRRRVVQPEHFRRAANRQMVGAVTAAAAEVQHAQARNQPRRQFISGQMLPEQVAMLRIVRNQALAGEFHLSGGFQNTA
jgi:hypothetical protein